MPLVRGCVSVLVYAANASKGRQGRWNLLSRSFTGSVRQNTINDNPTKLLMSKKAAKFRILCADSKGVRSSYEISKSSLYHELGLTVRDMRFQHTNMLAVRNRKIIVRFQKLKAIICSDAVLLIDPPFENDTDQSQLENDVADFWKTLPLQITGSVLYTSNLPLEYRALEAVFTHTLCNFSMTLSKLEPEITNLLSTLTDPVNLVVDRSLVHVLLKNSARLNTFATTVNEFCSMLDDLLECDEDIRDLCISANVEGDNRSLYDAYIFSPSVENEEIESDGVGDETEKRSKYHFEIRFPRTIHHKYKINLQDEMETLLDSFLKDAEEISNKVVELKEAIENSNTAILINLDSHRNLLLRLELQLAMGTFSCTLFGMLGMAFGMNLTSSLEESSTAFWAVSGVMIFGAGLSWQYLLYVLRNTPSNGSSAFLKTINTDGNKPTSPSTFSGGNSNESTPHNNTEAQNKISSSLNTACFRDRVVSNQGLLNNKQHKTITRDIATGSTVTSTGVNNMSGSTCETNFIEYYPAVKETPHECNRNPPLNRMQSLENGPFGVSDLFKKYSKSRRYSTVASAWQRHHYYEIIAQLEI